MTLQAVTQLRLTYVSYAPNIFPEFAAFESPALRWFVAPAGCGASTLAMQLRERHPHWLLDQPLPLIPDRSTVYMWDEERLSLEEIRALVRVFQAHRLTNYKIFISDRSFTKLQQSLTSVPKSAIFRVTGFPEHRLWEALCDKAPLLRDCGALLTNQWDGLCDATRDSYGRVVPWVWFRGVQRSVSSRSQCLLPTSHNYFDIFGRSAAEWLMAHHPHELLLALTSVVADLREHQSLDQVNSHLVGHSVAFPGWMQRLRVFKRRRFIELCSELGVWRLSRLNTVHWSPLWRYGLIHLKQEPSMLHASITTP